MLLENVLEVLGLRLPVDVLEVKVEDVAIVVTLGFEMHVPEQLVKVRGVEELEVLGLDVLALDVDVLDLEVLEVPALLEGVLVQLVEVLDVEGMEILVLDVFELDVDAGCESAGGAVGCAGHWVRLV